jgi:hypothetical protein
MLSYADLTMHDSDANCTYICDFICSWHTEENGKTENIVYIEKRQSRVLKTVNI